MNIYKKLEGAKGGKPRYTKNNILIKEARVPHDALEKLNMGVPEIELPDAVKPCLMCDDEGTRQKYYNQVIYRLCDWHYYNKNLGAIAQFLREEKEHGLKAKVSETSSQKGKRSIRKRKNVR